MALTKALLWLHLGDVESARSCARQAMENDENVEKLILALCDMADAEYETALEAWKELKESLDDEMVGVNTAVCLLYLGRIQEVCSSVIHAMTSVLNFLRDAQYWRALWILAYHLIRCYLTYRLCTSCVPRGIRT
jgi:tetratricopeptide (TPR) repeat protein